MSGDLCHYCLWMPHVSTMLHCPPEQQNRLHVELFLHQHAKDGEIAHISGSLHDQFLKSGVVGTISSNWAHSRSSALGTWRLENLISSSNLEETGLSNVGNYQTIGEAFKRPGAIINMVHIHQHYFYHCFPYFAWGNVEIASCMEKSENG